LMCIVLCRVEVFCCGGDFCYEVTQFKSWPFCFNPNFSRLCFD
jgi:hypothetical protein